MFEGIKKKKNQEEKEAKEVDQLTDLKTQYENLLKLENEQQSKKRIHE